MRNRRMIPLFLLLPVLLSFVLSCATLLPTPTPTITPSPTSTPIPTKTPTPTPILYDGEWKGQTSQGHELSFTVLNNAITKMAIKAELKGGGCSVKVETTGAFKVPYDILDGAFEISGGGGGTDYTFNGTFDSPRSASGTLGYVITTGCRGTIQVDWTATRAP